MANRKVTIDITTTANTSGAEKATNALDGFSTSSNRATKAVTSTGNSADKASKELDEFSTSSRRATTEVRETGNAANSASDKLDKFTTSSNAATTATAGVGKGASQAGRLVGQAGFQIQDFAVQVGGGTSALTAFAQQAPQLLGAFGPAGAIAGAVVAIGAIAAKVFMGMGEDVKSTEEKAKELATEIKNIGAAAEKAVQQNIDFGKKKIEDTTRSAVLLGTELANIAKNQRVLDKGVINSMTKLNDAEGTLQKLRGESADKLKLQNEQLAQQEATKKAEAALAKQIAQDALNDATNKKNIAEQELEQVRQLRQESVDKLVLDQESLRIKKEELKAIQNLSKETAANDTYSRGGISTTNVSTPAARVASSILETGSTQKEIERLNKTISEIAISLSAEGSFATDIRKAQIDVQTANSDNRKALDDFNTKVAEIDRGSVVDSVKTASDALENRAKIFGEEVATITENVVASTPKEKAALEVIKKNLKDKEIDLSEITSTTTALSELGSKIRGGLGENTQKVVQLIQIMQDFKAQSAQLQSQIDKLQGSKNGISGPLPSR
jgi:hypothetical protein